MNLRTLFSMVVLIAAAYGLYQVKWQVRELKGQNVTLQAQILEHERALRILRAEWTYLNRPERLRQLAERHLDLRPGAGTQMADEAQLASLFAEEEETIAEPSLTPGAMLSSARGY